MKKILYFAFLYLFEALLARQLSDKKVKFLTTTSQFITGIVRRAFFTVLLSVFGLAMTITGMFYLLSFFSGELQIYYGLNESQAHGILGSLMILAGLISYLIPKFRSQKRTSIMLQGGKV